MNWLINYYSIIVKGFSLITFTFRFEVAPGIFLETVPEILNCGSDNEKETRAEAAFSTPAGGHLTHMALARIRPAHTDVFWWNWISKIELSGPRKPRSYYKATVASHT
ncbi:hypothetical protein AVEN_70262-1 [Araneus ventricosus]|uniref:Uncharacterized protein n=1 Tax=Araneus ventricosus TaxID=182803 RepID=A0A4Y2G9Y8_ARAVE|nr:hypothetical protein AVEN_70262-1 [Araneus ventricosus]